MHAKKLAKHVEKLAKNVNETLTKHNNRSRGAGGV